MAPVGSPASFGQRSIGSPASFGQGSVALVQIDENSSLVQTSGNASVLLPHLLARTAFHADAHEDATPVDLLPKRHSYAGDCTPEAWPKTPTLVSHFGDQTPESWPEFIPSFRIDAHQEQQKQQQQQQDQQLQRQQDQPQQYQQQQAGFQAMPTMMVASPGITMLQPMLPIWSGQIGYPFGMVFDSSMASVPSIGVHSPPMLAPNANNLPPAVSGVRSRAFTARAPTHSSTVAVTKGLKASGVGCRKPAVAVSTGIATAVVGHACPVAVYVDLSALRELNVGPARVPH